MTVHGTLWVCVSEGFVEDGFGAEGFCLRCKGAGAWEFFGQGFRGDTVALWSCSILHPATFHSSSFPTA